MGAAPSVNLASETEMTEDPTHTAAGGPGARAPLTRERIVEAAVRLMDEEGLAAVTMRRVGRAVGVEAMSLYHHVRDKDDLLDGVVDHVMRGFPFPAEPGPSSEDLAAYGRAVAHAWRRTLRAHPAVVELLARRGRSGRSAALLRPVEVALWTLRRMGLSPPDAARAFHVIGSYVMGSVVLETGRISAAEGGGGATGHDLPPDAFPQVLEALSYLDADDPDERFDFGLDLMIEAIRTLAGRSREPERDVGTSNATR